MNRTNIAKFWLTNDAIWVETTEGFKAAEKFADYNRLGSASPQQRENYVLSFFGIHWPEIDEDLSYDGFFRNSGMRK